jgi:uncharacterized membrane protein
MRHKRSTPWIYRWSRPMMAALAAIGAVVTGYLTVVKFSQSAFLNKSLRGRQDWKNWDQDQAELCQ